MKRLHTVLLSCILITLSLYIISSCTVVGLGIGAVADKGKKAEPAKTIPAWGVVEELKYGSKIEVFEKDGSSIKGKYLRLLTHTTEEDTTQIIKLKVSSSSEVGINIKDIDYVFIEATNPRGKRTGLIIGATIDVLAIVAFVTNPPDYGFGPSGGSMSSCPFIYSYDGIQYRLDGEIFGGAIFQAAQRYDLDNLDFLKEVDGKLNLKITNELEETQYVDELKLLAIDHPAGTKVYPSFRGEINVIEDAVEPTKAVNKYGTDILSLVRETDAETWVSHPFGLNANDPADGRDWIDLSFTKPTSAKNAKLLFNVQNTLWGSYMQRILIDLHGDQQEAWYQHLNTSPEARKELMDLMIREGMMLIKVWNGETWDQRGFVWEIGPAIAKDIVELINIEDIQGEELKLRLEYPVGFWQVNSVQAEFDSKQKELTVTEIAAEKMVSHKGEDLLDLLANNDKNYYVMPDTSYSAELSFIAPNKDPELDRTFMLKSNGYYTIHPRGEGPAKTELFNMLKARPGAYAQFSLQRLDELTNKVLHEMKKPQ